MADSSFQTVYDFWFHELQPKNWFAKDERLDRTVRDRFLETHSRANRGELYAWRDSARGRLAEILVLDQFSRNMFRGRPESFASDALALVLAQEAVRLHVDNELRPEEKAFLYMPYMHSESLVIHALAVQLFQQNGLESNYEFELKHKAILERFDRYPHRNAILGRASTAEELEFLKQPGSGF